MIVEPDERHMKKFVAGDLVGNELHVYAASPHSKIARDLAKFRMMHDGNTHDVCLVPVENWRYERARVNILNNVPYVFSLDGGLYA